MADTKFIKKMQNYNVRERCKNQKKMASVAAVLAQLKTNPKHVKNS